MVLRTSRPLFVDSYLQVTWLALCQWKKEQTALHDDMAFSLIFSVYFSLSFRLLLFARKMARRLASSPPPPQKNKKKKKKNKFIYELIYHLNINTTTKQ